MNELPALLHALEPGSYRGTGAYQTDTGPAIGFPLEWDANLSKQPQRLIFEGTYRHHVGAPEHPFHLDLSLPSEVLGRGRFELHCPHLALVRGAFRSIDGGIVFAGRSEEHRVSVSMNLEVRKAQSLDAKGSLLQTSDEPWFFWFSFAQMEFRFAKANVVSLQSRSGC